LKSNIWEFQAAGNATSARVKHQYLSSGAGQVNAVNAVNAWQVKMIMPNRNRTQ
jgi:hypothetical protein